MMQQNYVTIATTLLFTITIINIKPVHSSWLPLLSSVKSSVSSNNNNFEHLQTKLSPGPGDVLDTIEEYTKFWIEVNDSKGEGNGNNNCVWSECDVDDVDEENEGDNRDGDEQWYQVNVIRCLYNYFMY